MRGIARHPAISEKHRCDRYSYALSQNRRGSQCWITKSAGWASVRKFKLAVIMKQGRAMKSTSILFCTSPVGVDSCSQVPVPEVVEEEFTGPRLFAAEKSLLNAGTEPLVHAWNTHGTCASWARWSEHSADMWISSDPLNVVVKARS